MHFPRVTTARAVRAIALLGVAMGLLKLAADLFREHDVKGNLILEYDNVRVGIDTRHGARVVSYSTRGSPNVFWTNPARDKDQYGWKNYGGEKTWIGPSVLWRDRLNTDWPPPECFDSAPYRVDGTLPFSRSFESPANSPFGLQVTRVVSIRRDTLSIQSRIHDEFQAQNILRDDRIRTLSIAQLRPPRRIAFRLVDKARVANGCDGGQPFPEPRHWTDNVIVFDLSDPAVGMACALDADIAVAEYPEGSLVMRHRVQSWPQADSQDTPETDEPYSESGPAIRYVVHSSPPKVPKKTPETDAPERMRISWDAQRGLSPQKGSYAELAFSVSDSEYGQEVLYTFLFGISCTNPAVFHIAPP